MARGRPKKSSDEGKADEAPKGNERARYVEFQMAEVTVAIVLFADILWMNTELRKQISINDLVSFYFEPLIKDSVRVTSRWEKTRNFPRHGAHSPTRSRAYSAAWGYGLVENHKSEQDSLRFGGRPANVR
jgi:hypothetical protein